MSSGNADALDALEVPVWYAALRRPTWLAPPARADAPRLTFAAEPWPSAGVDAAGVDLRLGVPAFLAEAARFGTNADPTVVGAAVDPVDRPTGATTVLSAVAPERRATVRVRVVAADGSLVAEIEREAADEASLGAALETLPFAITQAMAGAGVKPVWNSLYALPGGSRLAAYVRGLHAAHRISRDRLPASASVDAVAERRSDVRATLAALGTLATSTSEPFPALLFFGALLAAFDERSPVVGEFRLPANARWTLASDRADPVYALTALVARIFGDRATSERRIVELRGGGDPAMQRWLADVETVA